MITPHPHPCLSIFVKGLVKKKILLPELLLIAYSYSLVSALQENMSEQMALTIAWAMYHIRVLWQI